MQIQDPEFWRAGAIGTTAVMLVVLNLLTIDSLAATRAGSARVPDYDVIDRQIGYAYDWARGSSAPGSGAS